MKRKINILILLDSKYFGGIETHVLHLMIGLKHFDVGVKLLFLKAYARPNPLEKMLYKYNIHFEYLAGGIFDLYQYIKKECPDIVHTHGYKAGIWARLLSILFKPPIVSTFHNGDLGEGILKLYTYMDILTSFLSKNIAVSDEISKRLPASVVMNNFINLHDEYKLYDKNRSVIAFVGRLSYEKGPDIFLQLAKLSSQKSFVIFGDGIMMEEIKTNRTKNLEIKGHISNMSEYWHEIGILCVTSRQEGMPYVALEAMSYGIPIVSFAVGAMENIIQSGKNGWIVDDLAQMNFRIEEWMNESKNKREVISRCCYDTIKKNYSVDSEVPKIINIYNKLLKR